MSICPCHASKEEHNAAVFLNRQMWWRLRAGGVKPQREGHGYNFYWREACDVYGTH